ncbi:unnamed protein product [Arctogadus glacialis]
MMKTRFRAIFLQALEVHHTFVPHVITACAILHNICLGADDIMAPEEEDEPEDDVEEDEGGDGLEAASGAPCGTSCLQRCLPWRRPPLTTNIYSRRLSQPCKPIRCGGQWREAYPAHSGDHPWMSH